MPARTSCAPASGNRSPARRCGSCARRAGRCPSTGPRVATGSILSAIGDASLSAELTLQPVRRYGVDAAIVFSDIVVPLHAIGFGVEVEQGRGPVVAEPFRSEADLARLRPFEPDADAPYVAETVRPGAPRAGRVGGGADRVRRRTLHRGQLPGGGRPVAHLRPGEVAHARRPRAVGPADRPAGRHGGGLPAGPDRGRRARRCSSSTAGPARSRPAEYARFALPATRAVLEGIADLGVPTILFGVGTGELLALMGTAGSDVVGVDWRVPLDEARRRVGPGRAVAGQPRPGAVPGAVARRRGGQRGPSSPAPPTAPAPATSSTSATASCPSRTRPSWPRSSSWCTRRPGAA